MSTATQIIRGTTAENNVYTGPLGSLSVDTERKDLRIHDGITAGGFEIVSLIAVQHPTAENNYTWYRKYSDGWVEQGGRIIPTDTNRPSVEVPLLIEMADSEYICRKQHMWATSQEVTSITYQSNAANTTKNTTSVAYWSCLSSAYIKYEEWEVKGMAATETEE